MAAERINSAWDIATLEAEQKRFIGLLDEAQAAIVSFTKQAGGTELKLIDTKSVSETKGVLKQLETATQEITKATQKQIEAGAALADVELKLAKAYETNEKAVTQNVKTETQLSKLRQTIMKELEKLDKAKAQENKRIADNLSAYKQLDRQYKETAMRAKDLGAELGHESEQFKQVAAQAMVMRDRLLTIDRAIGDSRRQVGNYNMIAMQMGQVLRELPNAAISLQTFIISLTNNFNYFAEAVAQSRMQGQSWGQIVGSLATRANIMVAAINIGIAAITILSKKLLEGGEDAKKARQEIDQLSDSYLELAKAQVGAFHSLSDMTSEEVRKRKHTVEMLKAQGKTEKEIYEASTEYRNAEIALIESQIGKLGNLSAAVALNKEAILKKWEQTPEAFRKDEIKTILGSQSISDAFVETLVEGLQKGINTSDIIYKYTDELKGKIQEFRDDEKVEEAKFQHNQTETQKKEQEKRLKEYERYLERQKQLRAALQEASNSFKAGNVNELEAAINQINLLTGDAENDLILKAFGKGAKKNKDNALGNLAKDEQAEMIGVEASYNAGLYSYEQYQNAKTEVAERYADKRLDIEIQGLKRIIELLPENSAERLNLEKALQDAELQQLKNHNKKKEQADKDSAKTREQVERERVQTIIGILQQLSIAYSSINAAIIAANRQKIQDMEREQQLVDRKYNQEINLILAKYTNEEERIEKVSEAEGKRQDELEKIDERQRVINRRNANAQKSAAIFEATINVATAVTKVIDRIPLAIAVAIAGAAQIAAIASTPLPEYEDGTMNHPGGRFIAGDGGERELVVTPGGKSYWTKSVPTVYDEPAGTKVLNSDMINSLFATMSPHVIGNLQNQKQQAIQTDARAINEVRDAIKQNTKDVTRAIQRSKPDIRISGYDSFYNRNVKGKK